MSDHVLGLKIFKSPVSFSPMTFSSEKEMTLDLDIRYFSDPDWIFCDSILKPTCSKIITVSEFEIFKENSPAMLVDVPLFFGLCKYLHSI